jgi:hypothetical protein
VNLLRDGERQTIVLQADNRSASKLCFLVFLSAKRALIERDSLRDFVNDQMTMMKAVMGCVSSGHVFLLMPAGFVQCSSATGNRDAKIRHIVASLAGSAKGARKVSTSTASFASLDGLVETEPAEFSLKPRPKDLFVHFRKEGTRHPVGDLAKILAVGILAISLNKDFHTCVP